VVLLGYIATYFTYKTSFIDEITAGQFGFDLFVDFCFFVDICLTFFTVTQDKNGLIESRRGKIAKNYIKSVFFLDCFTTIPWGLIERVQEKYNQGNDYANRDDIKMLRIIRLQRLYRLLRILRLLKVLRLLRLKKLTEGGKKTDKENIRENL
jgi:hypothetical protein